MRARLQALKQDQQKLYRTLEPFVVFSVGSAAIDFQVLVPNSIASDARYLVPSVEGVALVALLFILWLERKDTNPRDLNLARKVSIGFITIMGLATAFELYRVLDRLLGGQVHDGRQLVFAGMKLWGTFLIVFALIYWELDLGGPVARHRKLPAFMHLRFPQNEDPKMYPKFRPTFSDYLYVSVTNSTAFSPTDTMPLTHSAKFFMGIQALLSLATIGIIGARAVNIL